MYSLKKVADQFPKFKEALNIHLIEVSRFLREKQASKLAYDKNSQSSNNIPTFWHDSLNEVPKGRNFLNELCKFLLIFSIKRLSSLDFST